MGDERAPCPECGDTRVAFDEAYQPRCFTCGASRVQPATSLPPQFDRDAILAAAEAAGEPRPVYRSPDTNRRDRRLVLVIVGTLVLVVFMIVVTALAAPKAKDSGSLRPAQRTEQLS